MAFSLPQLGLLLFDRLLRGRVSRQALFDAELACQRDDLTGARNLLQVALISDDPTRLAKAADLSRSIGDTATALLACARALSLDPLHGQATAVQAFLDLPGPPYLEVLARIHLALQPQTYLEIGVSAGDSIRLAGPATRAIGVDPAPQIAEPLPPHVRLFNTTSDAFFAGAEVADALGGQPVDLAFIDGMHQCEFALRDFINIERYCTRGSTVLIHDCYPLNRATSERERRTAFWTGDAWRAIVALRRHRPDLRVHVIATPPSGLAVVRHVDPGSKVLAERYDEIVAEMLALDYAVLQNDKAGVLNRFPNEWERVTALLAA
jgi:hypothetical protein